MTPAEFKAAACRLYGRRHWARDLATALGINPSTIRRLLKHEQIPFRYEVAIKGLLERKLKREQIPGVYNMSKQET